MFSKTVFTSLVIVAAVAQGALAQAANCARNYTVRLGDTCDAISAAQNVSTFQLAFVNPKIDAGCDNLALGEPLCLGITGQDCTTVHVVAVGDFCSLIATEASIPLSTLLSNNPNVNANCTNIGISEVLCTSSTLFNYTTTA